MVRPLLVRGMLAGLLAGILAFGFGRIVGEPPLSTAIAFGSYVEYTVHHEKPEMELVSRPLQSSIGLGTGTLIYGVALGGIFALVFAAAYGRLKPFMARGTAALLGCLGFLAIYLAPFLKYPANPPSIGDPDTIGRRTFLYLVMVLASVTAMVLAVTLRPRLLSRFGEWNATLLVGAGYVVAMILCYAGLPGINEVPQQALPAVIGAVTGDDVTFPPTILWGFRVASIGLQAVSWATIALVFGVLAQRQLETADASSESRLPRALAQGIAP